MSRQELLLLAKLSIILIGLVMGQINESPIAPLPQENSGAIQGLIDSLLNPNNPTESSTNQPEDTIYDEETGLSWPLVLINSTKYWDMENLESEQSVSDSEVAKEWLDGYLTEADNIFNIAAEAGWHYFTNFTEANRKFLVDSETVLAQFLKATATQARQFDLLELSGNSSMQRMLQMLSLEGLSALPAENFTEFTAKQRQLAEIYSSGAVCEKGRPPPCTLGQAELRQVLAGSYDPSELAYLWLAWHNNVGVHSREPYLKMVELSNEGARMNGFSDAGELWRSPYEGTAPTLGQGPMFSLQNQLEHLYQAIMPLYSQLHAYVRRHLAASFPANSVPGLTSDGPIPAHILGSMEGDNWGSLYHSSTPYPDAYLPATDEVNHDPWAANNFPPEDPLTTALRNNNYTVLDIFKQAEKFYMSLGFKMLPESFWNQSIFTRPWDKDIFCYPPAAFDLRNAEDYRVKICAQVSRDFFIEAHRLLGHTYYQREYRHLALPFREGANPSLPKAIAEAAAMASANRDYLASLKLTTKKSNVDSDYTDGEMSVAQQAEINRLYSEALQFIAPLPFQLVVDFWRWGVFDGTINETAMNSAWWDLKERLQGIKPLGERKDTDFDPAATTVIATQQFPAVRQFMTYVMQFQTLKALCKHSGYTDSLDIQKCNIYGSKKAGKKLRSLMKTGISEPWPKSFKRLTGQEHMDAAALMEYFKPLHSWLENANSRDSAYVGWDGIGTPFNFTELVPEWETGVPYAGDYANPYPPGSELAGAAVDIKAVEKTLPDRDDVAFPGEDCSNGRLCLQDSVCNGTHCECALGMVQWEEYCLPNNPNMEDFGDNGGFVLNVEEELTTAVIPGPDDNSKKNPNIDFNKSGSSSLMRSSLSLCATIFSMFCAVFLL